MLPKVHQEIKLFQEVGLAYQGIEKLGNVSNATRLKLPLLSEMCYTIEAPKKGLSFLGAFGFNSSKRTI